MSEGTEVDERQAQLRALASDLIYWKGGLKVLRQAQLPKWRGTFKWQIEAKIEALQAAYASLCAEAAKEEDRAAPAAGPSGVSAKTLRTLARTSPMGGGRPQHSGFRRSN